MLATWAKYLTLKIGLVEKSTFLFLHVYVWLVCLYMYAVQECMHTWSPEWSTFYIEAVSLRQTQISLLPLAGGTHGHSSLSSPRTTVRLPQTPNVYC